MTPASCSGQSEADLHLDLQVATLLKFGVGAAAALVLLGSLLLWARHTAASPLAVYGHFHGEPVRWRAVFSGALHGDGESLVLVGLAVLAATPVARVVVCAVGFLRQHDLLYTAISLLVLAVLLFALL